MATKQVRQLQPGDRVRTKWGEVATVRNVQRERASWWIYWTDETGSGGYAARELVEVEPS